MAKRTIPKSGWVVVGHIDHRAPVIPCAKCNRHVRYGVVMRHPAHPGTIEAGARCRIWLSGGTPERAAPHDAPAPAAPVAPAAAVDPVEAEIEAREAADEYGAELRNAGAAVAKHFGPPHLWMRVLDDRRADVPLRRIRHRAERDGQISLRRLAQIGDYLVAHHAAPFVPPPGAKPIHAECLLMHLPRAERLRHLAQLGLQPLSRD